MPWREQAAAWHHLPWSGSALIVRASSLWLPEPAVNSKGRKGGKMNRRKEACVSILLFKQALMSSIGVLIEEIRTRSGGPPGGGGGV